MRAASRAAWRAGELFWLGLFALASPLGVLVIVLPVALVVKLVAWRTGLH